MPIYDFQCSNCKTIYEHFMSIKQYEKAEKGIACDDTCNGTQRPIIGAPAFIERFQLRIADSRQRRRIKT